MVNTLYFWDLNSRISLLHDDTFIFSWRKFKTTFQNTKYLAPIVYLAECTLVSHMKVLVVDEKILLFRLPLFNIVLVNICFTMYDLLTKQMTVVLYNLLYYHSENY